MVKNSFIALDFETANKRTSICSVGIIKVVDNRNSRNVLHAC